MKALHKSSSILTVSALILLSACIGTEEEASPPEPSPADAAVQEPAVRETKNVTYQGTVKPLNREVYSEGTHRLQMESDAVLLIESPAVDLNGYVNEDVRITGAVRPAKAEDAMLMRVERIALIEAEEKPVAPPVLPDADGESGDVSDADSQQAEEVRELERSESQKEEQLKVEVEAEEPEEAKESEESKEETSELVNQETSELPSDDKESTVTSEDPEDVAGEESTDTEASDDEETPTREARVEVKSEAFLDSQTRMANEDIAAERWTQQYCSSHIGFCIPVHKNWWYTSFGSTSSHLWHVELSASEIDKLGDGPLIVKLLSGTVGSKKAFDKQVRTEGSLVVGYREWDDSRHIQVVADASLEGSVRFITERLFATEE